MILVNSKRFKKFVGEVGPLRREIAIKDELIVELQAQLATAYQRLDAVASTQDTKEKSSISYWSMVIKWKQELLRMKS